MSDVTTKVRILADISADHAERFDNYGFSKRLRFRNQVLEHMIDELAPKVADDQTQGASQTSNS